MLSHIKNNYHGKMKADVPKHTPPKTGAIHPSPEAVRNSVKRPNNTKANGLPNAL